MPWCERCDRFLNPNTVQADGTCPSCGQPVDPVGAAGDADEGEDDDRVRAPWHFWVMVVGVVVYLGWRLIELVVWAVDNWL